MPCRKITSYSTSVKRVIKYSRESYSAGPLLIPIGILFHCYHHWVSKVKLNYTCKFHFRKLRCKRAKMYNFKIF